MLSTIMVKTAIIMSMVTTPVGGMVYTTNIDDAVFSIEKVATDKFKITFDRSEGYANEYPEYGVEEYSMTVVGNGELALDTIRINDCF